MFRSSSTIRFILARSCNGRSKSFVLPSIAQTSIIFPFNNNTHGSRNFADFSMTQLKELRAVSGAPIVDCKKALTESNGDLETAMDWLRQHGAAKAAMKAMGREAVEGLVACEVATDGKSASLVKVSSETDFAGKSAAFVDLVTHVAGATLNNKEEEGRIDPETVLKFTVDTKTVQTAMEEAIVAIRENLSVSSAIKITTTDGTLVSYVHGKVNGSPNAGLAAAVVELVGDGVAPEVIQETGKKLAMHIVAAKPLYLNAESVPNHVIEKEKGILKAQMDDMRKPPDVVEKIVNGKLRKFYEENCLVEQEHMVEEGKIKVANALQNNGLTVRRFETFAIK